MNENRRQYKAKLCFLLDVTGSMDPVINAVRDFLLEIIEYCEKNYPQINLEVGFVGYRDVDSGRRSRYEKIPFMSDIKEFKRQFVAACDCTGGGDEAEDVLGGMQKALELNWDHNNTQVKVLVHCGDSPHHGKIFHDKDIHDGSPELEAQPRPYTAILADFADNHIDYTFAQIKNHQKKEFTTNRMLQLFSDAYNSYPSRRSNFKNTLMDNFSPRDLFASVRESLSSSIQLFMQSINSPAVVVVSGSIPMVEAVPISPPTGVDRLLKNVLPSYLPGPPPLPPPSAPPLPHPSDGRELVALERGGGGCCVLM